MVQRLILTGLLFAAPALAAAQDNPAKMVEVDPIRCWWRYSRSTPPSSSTGAPRRTRPSTPPWPARATRLARRPTGPAATAACILSPAGRQRRGWVVLPIIAECSANLEDGLDVRALGRCGSLAQGLVWRTKRRVT